MKEEERFKTETDQRSIQGYCDDDSQYNLTILPYLARFVKNITND